MEQAKKILLDSFYEEFYIFLSLIIIQTLLLFIVIIFYCVKLKKFNKNAKIGIPIMLIVLLITNIFCSVLFSKYYKDYKYLKENGPIIVEGIVIDFAYKSNNDDSFNHKAWPIVFVNDTNEKIALGILHANERVSIGQGYNFIYLPNTKIAEILEE